MSRFDINEFFERQDRLFPLGKLTKDLARYEKLIPNFESLNIPPIISPTLQAVLDNVNSMPKIDLGQDVEALSSALGTNSLSTNLQLVVDRISFNPINSLILENSRLQGAFTFSSQFQHAIDQVTEMHKTIDLATHSHWNSIADLTKTLGLNGLTSISQELALKAAELDLDFSDVARFESEEINSAIDKLSDDGFMDDFLSTLKKVKNNEDFKAYGFPIIWSLVILWLGVYIGILLESNNIGQREVKRELKNNSHYYQAEYNDSNFRVIAKNGVRFRTEPKRIEETIIFELSAFTGVTIIECPSGRSSWVKVSLSLDGIPLEGWVATRYLQRIR